MGEDTKSKASQIIFLIDIPEFFFCCFPLFSWTRLISYCLSPFRIIRSWVCVHVCVSVCVWHVCARLCVRTRICVHIYACVLAGIYGYTCVCVYVCMRGYVSMMSLCTSVYTHLCVCVHEFTHEGVRVCVCMHMDIWLFPPSPSLSLSLSLSVWVCECKYMLLRDLIGKHSVININEKLTHHRDWNLSPLQSTSFRTSHSLSILKEFFRDHLQLFHHILLNFNLVLGLNNNQINTS